MADDPKTDPPQGDPPQGDPPKEDSAEEKFWAKLSGHLDEAIDRGVKKHLGQRQTLGTKRTEGRHTIPEMFADFMFGKPKE